ncbi:hypothetical protein ACFSC4_07550 [Deinococcus malanensis]|uniref:hypothetical protein n=1 Tax=Deinococcus malanensis TaxID=1706855 RepID=UPI00362D417C
MFKRPPGHLPRRPGAQRAGLPHPAGRGVSLKFSSKTPGQEMVLREVVMDFRYDAFGAQLESPYSRLLLDAMVGDATLFPREDEVDHAWQIVSGLLDSWDTLPGRKGAGAKASAPISRTTPPAPGVPTRPTN